MPQEKPKYISTRQAAQMLGVTIRTIQNWVDAGKLNARLTLGGHRRLLEQDVIALAQAHTQEVRPSPARRKDDSKVLKVLVVEDNLALLELYELRLAAFSVPTEVYLAKDGFEGLLMLGRHQPAMLVLDLMMPGMDGFEMLRKLQEMPEYADIKVVVVTALGAPEIAAKGGLPKDVYVLPKPVPFQTLETLCLMRAAELGLQTGVSTPAAEP